MSTIEIVSYVYGFCVYIPALLIYAFPVKKWMQNFRHEVHPFVPYMAVADLGLVAMSNGLSAFDYIVHILVLVGWYLTDKDNDDDRWQRRRKSLLRVVRSGGKLVTE
jgi:hypothetical protein